MTRLLSGRSWLLMDVTVLLLLLLLFDHTYRSEAFTTSIPSRYKPTTTTTIIISHSNILQQEHYNPPYHKQKYYYYYYSRYNKSFHLQATRQQSNDEIVRQKRTGGSSTYKKFNNKSDQRNPKQNTINPTLQQQSDTTTTANSVPNKNNNNQQQQQTKQQVYTTRYYAVQALLPKNTYEYDSPVFAVDRLESLIKDLDVRNRSFCRLMVTTVERRLGQIDTIIANYSVQKKSDTDNDDGSTKQQAANDNNKKNTRRKSKADLLLQAVLRVGAVQLLFLNVPSHAAVKETIDILRMIPKSYAVVPEGKIKFANAILRRIDREGRAFIEGNPDDVIQNGSPWFIQQLQNQWGVAATIKILQAAMEESPRCLSVNLRSTTLPSRLIDNESKIQWVADQISGDAILLPQGSIVIPTPPAGTISSWPYYNDGLWWCQDPSATIPALALYQTLSANGQCAVDDRRVIDLCASPGGKTAQLWSYGFGHITAVDISSKRCERLYQNKERLQMSWETVIADGTTWSPSDLVDGVVIDVPCTATGTGSKRPDVLRRTDRDLSELLITQYKLLCNAIDNMISSQGVVVYSTCSILQQESEEQILRLLKERPTTVRLLPFVPGEIPGFDQYIDPTYGWIRVLPGHAQEEQDDKDGDEGSSVPIQHLDGFFVARIEKIQ